MSIDPTPNSKVSTSHSACTNTHRQFPVWGWDRECYSIGFCERTIYTPLLRHAYNELQLIIINLSERKRNRAQHRDPKHFLTTNNIRTTWDVTIPNSSSLFHFLCLHVFLFRVPYTPANTIVWTAIMVGWRGLWEQGNTQWSTKVRG